MLEEYPEIPPAPALIFDDSWMHEEPEAYGEIGQYKECEEVERLEEMREEEERLEREEEASLAQEAAECDVSLQQGTEEPGEVVEKVQIEYPPIAPTPALVFDDSWMHEEPEAYGEIGQYKECEEVERLEEMREEEARLSQHNAKALDVAQNEMIGGLQGLALG
jgi:hypothetical protein